jgi:hypothetical protein
VLKEVVREWERLRGERETRVGNVRALTEERIIFIINFFLLLSLLRSSSHKIIFKENRQ